VILCNKVRSHEIRKILNVKHSSNSLIKEAQLRWFRHVTKKVFGETSHAGYTCGKTTQGSSKDQVE